MSKSRLEAFSDGVFAIAITLLVLTIAQPENYHRLGDELADRWPSIVAYVVSFTVIGIMWLNHHSIFAHFARVDRAFVYLNLLLLLTVVFIPYPTGIFGEALRQGEGERVAAVVYSVAMLLNAVAWAALWLYASTRRRLLDDAFPETERLTATVLFTIGPVLYGVAVIVAFINAYACLAFHAILALYYALDPLSRRAQRANTSSDQQAHDVGYVAAMTAIGDTAPDFTLKDQNANDVTLSSLRGQPVVIVFYPFTFTGICEGELCEIRDDPGAFERAGAQVLAISCDTRHAQRMWAEQQGFTFPVLSDFWPHGAVAKAYGVFNEALGCANRATFVLDKDGVVVDTFSSPDLGTPRAKAEYDAALAKAV